MTSLLLPRPEASLLGILWIIQTWTLPLCLLDLRAVSHPSPPHLAARACHGLDVGRRNPGGRKEPGTLGIDPYVPIANFEGILHGSSELLRREVVLLFLVVEPQAEPCAHLFPIASRHSAEREGLLVDAVVAIDELPAFLERVRKLVTINQAGSGRHRFQETVVECRQKSVGSLFSAFTRLKLI